VFCGNNPINFRDPFGLCKETKIEVLDARAQLKIHYERAKELEGLVNQFFIEQDTKESLHGKVFRYDGKLISPGFMGNMNVGYTATRLYGWKKAVDICAWGEVLEPDPGQFIEGAKGSLDANAIGIVEAMWDDAIEAQGVADALMNDIVGEIGIYVDAVR
jgi:hypothetical protein